MIKRRQMRPSAWWAEHPEERERLAELGRQRWREVHPERAAIRDRIRSEIAAGLILEERCDGCGGQAEPWIDYTAVTVKGWRCRECWKATRVAVS